MSIRGKQALKMIAKNASNPSFKILDVRTLPERNALCIPNSDHVPLHQLPYSISSFNKQNTYLVYCRVGVRSLEAANLMNSHGLNAINMMGGIIQWSMLKDEESVETGPIQYKKEQPQA